MRSMYLCVVFVVLSVLIGCGGPSQTSNPVPDKSVSDDNFCVLGQIWDPCNLADPPHGVDVSQDDLVEIKTFVYDHGAGKIDYLNPGRSWGDTDSTGHFVIVPTVHCEMDFYTATFHNPNYPGEPDVYNAFPGYYYDGMWNTLFDMPYEWYYGIPKTLPRILVYQQGSYTISGTVDDQGALTEQEMLAITINSQYYQDQMISTIVQTHPDKYGNWSISGLRETCFDVWGTDAPQGMEFYRIGNWDVPLHVDANTAGLDFVVF